MEAQRVDDLWDALDDAGKVPERIGLELEGKRAAREGCQIRLGDSTPMGMVTSGSYVPWLENSIAMRTTLANGWDGTRFTNAGLDLAGMDFHDSVHVSALKLPEGCRPIAGTRSQD